MNLPDITEICPEGFCKDSIRTYAETYVLAYSNGDNLRVGQMVFNTAFVVAKEQAILLTGSEYDCYYLDSNIDIFLDKIEELINKGGY